MKAICKKYKSLYLFTILFILSNISYAESISGQIGVKLTISSGCSIENSSTSATGSWGTLDFGSYADLKNTIDGAVVGNSSATGLSITCSDGTASSLTLNGGLNGTGSQRLLKGSGTSTTTIPYRLYSDSARSSEITDGTISITGNGSAQIIPIYGRIIPADLNGATSPAADTYTDTITATISW